MLEDPIDIVIGGKTWHCPPMPFYCLERAWPHIQRLAEMNAVNEAIGRAQMQVRQAETAEQHEAATQALSVAVRLVQQEGSDIVGQTREALKVIVAALALQSEPPSYEDLSRAMRPAELHGIHAACSQLLATSGLAQGEPSSGEALAMRPPMPGHLNGAASSLN